ncbi:MAG: dTMP kinase [Moraxellaceae bacterium]|nr:dTMP kinase [Pseudobdellovibrionaceae bacterium]
MFFMVFEGLDGSGKSSLIKMLDEHLAGLSFLTVVTREPGGTDVGDQLRDLLLQKRDQAPTPRTELLLYQASRSQHVDLVIRPGLAQKKWVLCDRFSASSVAFQGGGRGISKEQVEWLNQFSTNNLVPDLTVLLDLSVGESKKRRLKRSDQTGSEDDRIESEKDEFHERVRSAFLSQALESKSSGRNNWLVLNAALAPDELFKTLIDELRSRSWIS